MREEGKRAWVGRDEWVEGGSWGRGEEGEGGIEERSGGLCLLILSILTFRPIKSPNNNSNVL